MIHIAIVEDQKVYQQELQDALNRCFKRCNGGELPDVACYESGDRLLHENSSGEGLSAAFIDIELPGMSGMEVAKALRENGYKEMIVFTTNYEQFVYEGYEVEAFRYLLKPVKDSEIQKCVERIKQNALGRSLVFSFNKKQHHIPYDEIIYVSSYGHYVTLHTKEHDYDWKYSLKELQPQLPEQFVRCHRSFIVNLDHMRKLSGKRMIMKNSEQIDVAPGYLDEVRKALSEFV